MSDITQDGPMLAADGTPLKKSLARALRRQKIRALMLIAPLLIFVLVTFIAPIADMLFRSVENQIVRDTLPRTVVALKDWNPDGEEIPGEPVFQALNLDFQIAAEEKNHTKLGSRLNYENPGISSVFRATGRGADKIGKEAEKTFTGIDPRWKDPAIWAAIFASPEAETALPRTAGAYEAFAKSIRAEGKKEVAEAKLWPAVFSALLDDLTLAQPDAAAVAALPAPGSELVGAALAAGLQPIDAKKAFLEINDGWSKLDLWQTISAYSPPYTAGYFLNAADFEQTSHGIEARPPSERIYLKLFWRTLWMSMTITVCCILLGYPVAWLLANLRASTANVLMILVLLPFWTSLLVRTSAWKVLLQQQGVINDLLVWMGLVSDGNRLVMINNQFGTIIAMTHILLPFMILPLYSVMKTVPPSYVRAAKSLGATPWTAFWRVYFPQSIPGIGAGSILCFILAIGYYITPELVGGTEGVFISRYIAYHISTSLNWGLAAALGTILLAAVLLLYYVYDKIVGIDNVKLG